MITGEPSRLPSEWQSARLGDKFTFTRKPRELRLSDSPAIPFVPMEHIPSGRLHLEEYSLRSPSKVSSGTYFEEGDLLLPKITPCFENGKQAIAIKVPGGFGVATTEVIPIKAIEGLSYLPFLALYLLHPDVRRQLAGKMEGATGRQRLPADALREWTMPFPPLHEQRAIVGVLSLVQEAADLTRRRIVRLKELKAATIAKLFREGLRREPLKQTEIGEIPRSWNVVQLGTMAKIGNGSTPKRDNPSYWEGGTIPWLTSAKVHDAVIEAAAEFISPTARAECHLPLVQKDSLVLAITGQGKTLGNVALVRFDTCVSQHLAYIQFVTDQVVPKFMLFFLQGKYKDLRQVSQGGGSTRGALTCGFLKGYKVPLPSSQEQEQIANTLDAMRKRVRAAENRHRALGVLFASILDLLMTGQVRVPPGLIDGQAPARLERKPAPEVIDEIVRRIVEAVAPEKIVLFGSAVSGSPSAKRGVGVLVVMPFEGRSLAKAIEIERTVRPQIPLEILVRRPEDMNRALQGGDPFIKGIVERGRLMHTYAIARAPEPSSPRPVRRGAVSEEVLGEIVQRIVEVAAPSKIILFGSAARGEMGPDSDIDLLVVTETDQPRETARRIRQRLIGVPPGIPKDVIVVTPEHLERHKDTIGFIFRPALREGRVLHVA